MNPRTLNTCDSHQAPGLLVLEGHIANWLRSQVCSYYGSSIIKGDAKVFYIDRLYSITNDAFS